MLPTLVSLLPVTCGCLFAMSGELLGPSELVGASELIQGVLHQRIINGILHRLWHIRDIIRREGLSLPAVVARLREEATSGSTTRGGACDRC